MKNWLSFLLLLWGLSGAGARVWRSGLSINVWVIDCRAGYKAPLSSGAVNRISLERWGSRTFGGWYGAREGNPAAGLGMAKAVGRGRDLVLEEQFEGGLRFAVACRLLGSQPGIQQLSDRACEFVTPLDTVQSYTVLVSIATSDEADDPVREAIALLDRAEARTISFLVRVPLPSTL